MLPTHYEEQLESRVTQPLSNNLVLEIPTPTLPGGLTKISWDDR